MSGIFISYRREDTGYHAGHIYEKLVQYFGDHVLKDANSTQMRDDFIRGIEELMERSAVVLVLIGDNWLAIDQATGRTHLDNPDDFVRQELELALRSHNVIIPLLVGRAELPEAIQLPESLSPLVHRSGMRVRPQPHFHADMETLIRKIAEHVQPLKKEHVPSLTPETVAHLPVPDAGESPMTCLPTPISPPGESQPVLASHILGYEILGELGRGGMGVVYEARQIGLDRTVALKVVLHAAHAGTESFARFRNEAQAIARLQHVNIVAIYEIGDTGEAPYFSMEYCQSGSLAQRLTKGPMDPREAVELVRTLALAVQSAHDQRIIHRDLKPANILFSADGTPKIADFGLARRTDEAGQTASGTVLGTPNYMSPEQARGKVRELGPSTDIYALGAILYECLTGKPPFHKESTLDTLVAVVSEQPPPVRQIRPELPVALEAICSTCLDKDPSRRPASAQALASNLQVFLHSHSSLDPVAHELRLSRPNSRPPLVSNTESGTFRTLWLWFAICRGTSSLILACLFLFWLVSHASESNPDRGSLTFLGFLMMIGGAISLVDIALLLILLHRCWAILEDVPDATSPGFAVGGLFVPIFNLYWIFIAVYGLARTMNARLAFCQIGKPRAAEGLGVAVCILWVFSVVTGALSLAVGFLLIFALLAILANTVLWILFTHSLVQTAAVLIAVRGNAAQHYERKLAVPVAGQPVAAAPGAGRRSLWYNALVYMSLFGLAGGFLAWTVGELVELVRRTTTSTASEAAIKSARERLEAIRNELNEDIRQRRKSLATAQGEYDAKEAQILSQLGSQFNRRSILFSVAFFVLCGGIMACFLGVAEPFVERNWPMAAFRGSLGLMAGIVGGAIVGSFIDTLYHGMGGGKPGTGIAIQIVARAIGWGIVGMFLSVSAGLVLRNWKKCLCGVAGGLLGGLIGGCLFDPILMATKSDILSRLFQLLVIGSVSGLATGLIENWAKTAWVRIVRGVLAGKQIILYRNPTCIGSSARCEIFVFKDSLIAPRHAAFFRVSGGFELEDLQSGIPTYVNGRPIRRQRLNSEDQVQIGSTVFLFQERRGRQRNLWHILLLALTAVGGLLSLVTCGVPSLLIMAITLFYALAAQAASEKRQLVWLIFSLFGSFVGFLLGVILSALIYF